MTQQVLGSADATQFDGEALSNIDLQPASALFDGAARNEAGYLGAVGVRRGPAYSPSEVRRIRELIKARLIENAASISPAAVADLRAVELEDYHEVAHRHDHRKLLSKLSRILDAEKVAEIKAMSAFDYLRDGLGADCYLSDEEQIGHEQITYRIVRPNERSDVGSLHRDKWFWEHYDWPVPAGWGRTKAWVALAGDQKRAGLLLAPGSHRRDAPYHVAVEDNKVAFVPEFDVDAIGLRRYQGEVGEPVLFNYGVLHVGAINRAPMCRVSFEITMMFREMGPPNPAH
jgi:hypothetical protein